MLTKVLGKRLQLLSKTYQAFSSSNHNHHGEQHHDHDHDHHHHDYSVNIDKESPWIKYKSDPNMIAFHGVQDLNYKLQPTLEDDPFEHLKDQPFFSWNKFVYNDPWYHDDSHEPYNSLPNRGYINGQDPLQTRSFYSPATLMVKAIFMSLLLVLSMSDSDITYREAVTFNQKVSREFVIKNLEELNKQRNQLLARRAQLQQKVAPQ